jgi:hypothetical protein
MSKRHSCFHGRLVLDSQLSRVQRQGRALTLRNCSELWNRMLQSPGYSIGVHSTSGLHRLQMGRRCLFLRYGPCHRATRWRVGCPANSSRRQGTRVKGAHKVLCIQAGVSRPILSWVNSENKVQIWSNLVIGQIWSNLVIGQIYHTLHYFYLTLH